MPLLNYPIVERRKTFRIEFPAASYETAPEPLVLVDVTKEEFIRELQRPKYVVSNRSGYESLVRLYAYDPVNKRDGFPLLERRIERMQLSEYWDVYEANIDRLFARTGEWMIEDIYGYR